MHKRVRDFFLDYEKANSSSDPNAICELYAESFMFAGPHGVRAVKKEDFVQMVPRMKMYFASRGVSGTDLQTVEAIPLDSRYLLAKVVWRVNFRNSLGSKHVDVSATYVLARGQADELSIVVQIDHQDLARKIEGQRNGQP